MTSTAGIIDKLRSVGVTLLLVNGVLKFRAPPGAYTVELRKIVAKHKVEIVAYLAWDAARAGNAVAAVARLTRGAGSGTGRGRVLAAFQALADRWAESRDIRLYEIAPGIEVLLDRWQREDDLLPRDVIGPKPGSSNPDSAG